jgi:hypothetical protein
VLETFTALGLSEAWPEGYNYWVNSRGFLVALAGYSYVTAFPDASAVDDARRIFSRIGLWSIHNTRPDVKAVQIADEGPRIDLGEGTQRIVDLLSLITRDPWLDSYSAMLDKRHGKRTYYRGNRWMRSLFQSRRPTAGQVTPLHSWSLPTAEWFGRDGMNMFYMRSDWGRDATMLSFRAGHNLSHHGHYDAGHFTLFKGVPLAATGATYRGDVNAGNRLDYSVRTVSKNSLLVMRPGEEVKPERYERKNKSDGGQRMTMPIRNPLATLADWRENLGAGFHLEGGRIRHYLHEPSAFTYVDADLTDAYNTPRHDEGGDGGKVSSVTRQLLYLRRLDRVLIRDRVTSTDPAFKAKWLLQSLVKPEVVNGMRLKGSADNGIIATDQAEFRFHNGRGRLHVLSLQPEQRETLVIGGKNYRFYVDVDGDAATLDGEIMGKDSRVTKWFEPAEWRLEISDRRSVAQQDFLTLLSPSLEDFNPPLVEILELEAAGAIAVRVDDEILVFVEAPEVREVTVPGVVGASVARVFGLPAGALISVNQSPHRADSAGTVSLETDGKLLSLSWSGSETLGTQPTIR